jgi:hypothetical protein
MCPVSEATPQLYDSGGSGSLSSFITAEQDNILQDVLFQSLHRAKKHGAQRLELVSSKFNLSKGGYYLRSPRQPSTSCGCVKPAHTNGEGNFE